MSTKPDEQERPAGPITIIFRELVAAGYIIPTERMEDMRLPGEFIVVPSIMTNSTPDVPVRNGIDL